MAAAPQSAANRRIVFGLKLVVDVALALGVAALVVWAAGRYGGQVDLTSSGLNSLSPRTMKLLRGLDTDVTITGMYTLLASDIRQFAEKRYQRVADLLDLYDSAGGARVTTKMIDKEKDPHAARGVVERIRSKPEYAGQSAPYEAVIAEFGGVQEALVPVVQEDYDALRGLVEREAALQQVRELTAIERNARIVLDEARAVKQELDRLAAAEFPQHGAMVEVIRAHLEQAGKALKVAQDWMTREGARLQGISSEATQFFAGARERYQTVIERIDALAAQADGLEPLTFEDVYRQLQMGQVVVVETPEKVIVLPQEEVWPLRTDGGRDEDQDTREFAGEQAISSAILRMTQTERTAVVFVRYGGGPLLQPDFSQMQMNMQRPPEAPYSMIDETMKKENFITAEWNVQETSEPPVVEGAARTVYVVFPPEDPGPMRLQNPSQPPPISEEQKQAVVDAVERANMGLFLVGWQPPSMPGMPGSGRYAYADYLRQTWGIDGQADKIAIHFMLNPRKQETFVPANMRSPVVLSTNAFEFTGHPIAEPLRSLPGALVAAPPLLPVSGEAAPSGVQIEPIAVARASDSIWAVADVTQLQSDFNEHQGTRRYEADLPAPFPVALAATRTAAAAASQPAGEDAEDSSAASQRLVVIGSEQFVANDVLRQGQMLLTGGGLVMVQSYPANRDLFINALHWLTGNADRIAVGPRRGDVPRLDRLEDGSKTAEFVKVFLVGIWPGIALLAGAAVWFMRRR